MSITVDLDMELSSHGPVYYNGHWVTYGVVFDEWSMRCVGCKKEIEGSTEKFYELSEEQEPYFWLSKFAEYRDQCSEPYESWSDAILEKIMMDNAGKLATPTNLNRIEKQIENDIVVGPADATVTSK